MVTVLNIGAPRAVSFAPTLCTPNLTATLNSVVNSGVDYADDTNIIGWISDNNKSSYGEEINNLAE